jgi:acyl-CoA synthetase (NDP forming)
MVDHMVKFTRQGIGISIATSIGNKALIREIDMLHYLAEDPRTRVIVFYIAGFEGGKAGGLCFLRSNAPNR